MISAIANVIGALCGIVSLVLLVIICVAFNELGNDVDSIKMTVSAVEQLLRIKHSDSRQPHS